MSRALRVLGVLVLLGTLGLCAGWAAGQGGERLRHLAVPVPWSPNETTLVDDARALPATRGCEPEPLPSARVPGRVSALWDDGAGTRWVGTFDAGLYRLRDDGRVSAVWPLEGRERFVNGLVRHGGQLWAATHGGLLAFDDEGRRLLTVAPELAVEAVLALPSGAVAVGSGRGLHLLVEGALRARAVRGPEGEAIRVTALAHDGVRLWLGSPSGAYHLPLAGLEEEGTAPPERTASWVPLVFGAPGARTNVVTALASLGMPGGGVVAGTDDGGLVRLGAGEPRAVRFQAPRANEVNPGAGLWVAADASRGGGGAALFGTQGAGLLRAHDDGQGGLEVVATTALRGRQVSALAARPGATPGGVWVGLADGEVLALGCTGAGARPEAVASAPRQGAEEGARRRAGRSAGAARRREERKVALAPLPSRRLSVPSSAWPRPDASRARMRGPGACASRRPVRR